MATRMADTMGIGVVLGFMTQGVGSLVAAHHQLRALETQMKSTDSAIRNFGVGMAQVVTGLIAMKLAAEGLKFAIGDIGLAGAVQTDLAYTSWIMDLSAEQTQEFRNQAIELATTYPVAIDSVTESMQRLARAGWDTNETLAMMPTIAQASVIGNMEMAEATDLLIAPIRALNLQGQDAAMVLDQLTMAANIFSGIELKDFRRAFGTFGGDMGAFNQSLSDTVSLFGTFTSRGMTAERAATMVKMVLQRTFAPSANSLGLFRQLGVQTTDAEGNFRSIIDVLQDLQAALASHPDVDLASAFDLSDLGEQSLQESQIIQTLFGARSAAGFRIAAESGQIINGQWVEGFESLRQNAERIADASGTASEGVAVMSQTWEYQWGLLKTSWGAFREELATNVLPALTAFVTQVTTVVKSLNEFIQKYPDLAKVIQALLIIWNIILFIAGAALAIAGLVKLLTVAFGVIKAAVAGIGVVVGGVSATVLGWILIILAAIVLIVVFRKQIWWFLQQVWSGIVWFFDRLGTWIATAIYWLYSLGNRIGGWLLGLQDRAISAIASVWVAIATEISSWPGKVGGFFAGVWNSIVAFLNQLWTGFLGFLNSAINAVRAATSGGFTNSEGGTNWATIAGLAFGPGAGMVAGVAANSFARGAYRFPEDATVQVHRGETLTQEDRASYQDGRGRGSSQPSQPAGVTIGTVNLTLTPTGSTQVDANRLFEQFLDKIEHNQARVMQAVGLPVKRPQ
jgi:TP901 family phage tail tape measure protein